MSRIRVLVVDDSVVVRRVVADALAADEAIDVVGTAANGRIAQAKIEQLAPDIVTMDVEMPVMDGIEAVRALRRAGSRIPVIMFSTSPSDGSSSVSDALAAGATEHVAKPTSLGSARQPVAEVTDRLAARIKALVPRRGLPAAAAPVVVVVPRAEPTPVVHRAAAPPARRAGGAQPRVTPAAPPDGAPRRIRAVVVGSSTGGPDALSQLFGSIDSPLAVPVALVQHMPAAFTRQLAARLDRAGPSTVLEAAGNEVLLPGHVYVAPGDAHLELRISGDAVRTALSAAQPVNFSRPAVDVLFRSAARVYGRDLLAVVLTGMGVDGRAGCEAVLAAGGQVIVQDEASSVVWGMPGAVARAGLAHRVLPLPEIGSAVAAAVAAGRSDRTDRSPAVVGVPGAARGGAL